MAGGVAAPVAAPEAAPPGGMQSAEAEGETIHNRSRRRNRPSKTKRIQYKKFVSSMLERIDLHPETCRPEVLDEALQELPPAFAQNERLKSKFIARCMARAEQARARRLNFNLNSDIAGLLTGMVVLSL